MHEIALLTVMLQSHPMHGMAHGPDPLSLFNHHLAGLLVILLGVLGYLDAVASGKREWLKLLWPVPLIALGIYLLLRSDAAGWPPNIAGQLSEAEGVQHKLFALLALIIGGIELGRRLGRLTGSVWTSILYGALFVAGAFLIVHGGHHARVVHLEHLGMGLVAISIVAVKMAAEWKTSAPWLSAYLLPSLFTLLGLQLVLYVE
jgi:hypothetical protein